MNDVSRSERYQYELLDRDDKVIQIIDGVGKGKIDYSISAEIRSSGTFNMTKMKDIDWLGSRVRVNFVSDELTVPLITAIPAVRSENYTATGVELQVDLYDKLMMLRNDNFGNTYAVPAGANIIEAAIAVIESTDEMKVNIPASSAVLSTSIVWEPNTSKYRIVNDLLDAANYFALWADGMGWFRSSPYVPPAGRTVMYDFKDDKNGLYLPEFGRNYDPFDVPNRYICIGKTDGEIEALTGEAEDTTAPFGYPYRPWKTITELDVPYSDYQNLQAIARRKLVDAQQVGETFEISHPYLGFGLNDLVTFANKRLGTRSAVVQKQTWTLDVGGLIATTLRSVNV